LFIHIRGIFFPSFTPITLDFIVTVILCKSQDYHGNKPRLKNLPLNENYKIVNNLAKM